jgi:hypothetical protein
MRGNVKLKLIWGTRMADKQLPTKADGNETVRESVAHDQERREAMKKLGKMAAYTAPALLALMAKPTKALAISARF